MRLTAAFPGAVAHKDLVALELPVDDSAAIDRCAAEFLSGGRDGFDQVPVAAYRALADLFDRSWLAATA